jgi:AcrR family transcriptional regulator
MPRNKYPEETVQKILDASLKLFMEKGYENTTVLDIVENMGGLTRGAFYHHFKSKEEVMSALSDKMFYENNPFERVKKDTNLNGLQKLQKITKESMKDTDYRRISIEAVPLLKNPKFLAELIESNRNILIPCYQELIEEGIADGSIETEYPKQTAEILTILTNFWLIPSIFPFDKEEGVARVQLLKRITDFLGIPIIDEEMLTVIQSALEELE